jgi:hypothetical protein
MSFKSELPKLATYVFCTLWNRVLRVDEIDEYVGSYRGTNAYGVSSWYGWERWRYATDDEIEHYLKAPKHGYEYDDVEEGEFVVHVASGAVLLVAKVFNDHGFTGVDSSGDAKWSWGNCRSASDVEIKRWRAGLQ